MQIVVSYSRSDIVGAPFLQVVVSRTVGVLITFSSAVPKLYIIVQVLCDFSASYEGPAEARPHAISMKCARAGRQRLISREDRERSGRHVEYMKEDIGMCWVTQS